MIKGRAKLIRLKKEKLRYWQMRARMETRGLSETIKLCGEIEKEIRELENPAPEPTENSYNQHISPNPTQQ